MTLTTDQMTRIVQDEMNGRKTPRETGKEADDFRKAIKPDIELAKKNGWEIRIPSEWPE
jgi:hypothetical protein